MPIKKGATLGSVSKIDEELFMKIFVQADIPPIRIPETFISLCSLFGK